MEITHHLARYPIKDVKLGAATSLSAGRLTLEADALGAALCTADARIAAVRVGLAAPGESTRIVCVKDVIEPRAQLSEHAADHETTAVIDGCAVATCGPIVGFQEGIIDMSGPGSGYAAFSKLSLIVLEFEMADGVSPQDHEAAVREAGLRAGEWIALGCSNGPPETRERVEWSPASDFGTLPRVAYINIVLSQGLLHDTYVFGRNAKQGLPRNVDPRVFATTAVVSGNCVSACDKNTTYHYQNHPLVEGLLAGHGTRWNFVGTIITNSATRLEEKEHAAAATVQQVVDLQAVGAVISKEGFGNPDTDLMMLIKGLETAGIATVGITDEFAGADGASQSIADTTPEATAMVSVGNANERIVLPPMARTFGPLPDVSRLSGGYPHTLRPDGSLEVEVQAILGSTNELGFQHLSCKEV